MQSRILACAALLCAPVLAQTTWIVNPAGGPGVNFQLLPDAVAAASDGDTILVQEAFLLGATPFTTSKGLTILGDGGQVPISTSGANPIRIVNLPATSTFRMVGFSRVSDGHLNFEIDSCAGMVHLERIRCRENEWLGPTQPTTVISNSANVTLREFGNFGVPAVDISDSRVSLVRCQLGVTHMGLGGWQCVRCSNSDVDIVEPRFDTSTLGAVAIESVNSELRLSGSSTSYVNCPIGPAVLANGGTVIYDPVLPLNGTVPVAGSAVSIAMPVPSTSTSDAELGQSMSIDTVAAVGAFVFHVLGTPAPMVWTPLGTLGLEVAQPYAFFPAAVAGANGVASSSLAIPATLTLGQAFATQAVVLQLGSLELSLPATFVVH